MRATIIIYFIVVCLLASCAKEEPKRKVNLTLLEKINNVKLKSQVPNVRKKIQPKERKLEDDGIKPEVKNKKANTMTSKEKDSVFFKKNDTQKRSGKEEKDFDYLSLITNIQPYVKVENTIYITNISNGFNYITTENSAADNKPTGLGLMLKTGVKVEIKDVFFISPEVYYNHFYLNRSSIAPMNLDLFNDFGGLVNFGAQYKYNKDISVNGFLSAGYGIEMFSYTPDSGLPLQRYNAGSFLYGGGIGVAYDNITLQFSILMRKLNFSYSNEGVSQNNSLDQSIYSVGIGYMF